MGTAQQHQRRAEHHLTLLDTIPDGYPDWLAMVAFRAAVELVEKAFAEQDLHHQGHAQRKRAVRQSFPRLAKSYHALYNASFCARCEPMEQCLDVEEVRRELIRKRLSEIREFVASGSR
jgi:hypothetical protein